MWRRSLAGVLSKGRLWLEDEVLLVEIEVEVKWI